MQDRSTLTDLPRPAEQIEAANLAGVPKLRNVRFRDGWVYADRPDTRDENQWWKPVETYYQGDKPYLALTRCEATNYAVASFLRTYGAINEERSHISPRQICFRRSDFEREQSHFAFVVELASGLKKPATLRDIFFKRLEEAVQNGLAKRPGWYPVMERIRWVLNVPQSQLQTRPYPAELVRKVKPRLQQMSDEALAQSAASYLTNSISKRLGNIKVWFECEADGNARLTAQCFDNLLVSFYWMLANDLATRHGPSRCAYCKRFFLTDKQNVAYCPDRSECKERGRRKVDWERNKAKYNRNRKRKRVAERRRRGKHEAT